MENKTYYHIHKKGHYDDMWSVGNIIEIDKNAFSEYSYNFSPLVDAYNQKGVPLLNVIDHSIKINDINQQLWLLNVSSDAIREYVILIRELTYEEVRNKNYPSLPSRNNCVWLCREEQLGYWRHLMGDDTELYKVELFSEPFKTRNSLISLPADSYNSIKSKANQYWSYNSEDLNEDDEYLYTGKFRIIEKVNSND